MAKSFSCLTTALLITVVRAIPLLVADLGIVNAFPRLAQELSGCTGGFGAPAQSFQFIRAVPTVCVSVAYKHRWDTHSILAGELMTRAGVIHAADLIAAISAVIYAVTADERSFRCTVYWSY